MRQPAHRGKDDEVVPWLESIDGAEEQQDPGQQDSNHCYRPALAKGQIIRISAGMLGLMFGWAIKTVLTTPLFRDVYGVETSDLGFIWLAGPLSGLIIQPVIGVISDHQEREGQRSYFFALGAVLMAVSLVVLPSAGNITRGLKGERKGDFGLGNAQTSDQKQEGIGLAVAAFWMLDLAMNASLVAIRAIIADGAPPEQQPEANTAIIISYGVGTFLGYGFGAFNAARWLGLPAGPLGKACVDFGTAALVLLVTAAIACREAFLLERSHAFSRRSHVSSLGRTDEDKLTRATSDVTDTHRSLEEARTVSDPAWTSTIESHCQRSPKDSCTMEDEEQQVFAQMNNGYRRIDGGAEPGAVTTGGCTGNAADIRSTGGSRRAGDEGNALTRNGLDESCVWREASEGDQRGEIPGRVVSGAKPGGDRAESENGTQGYHSRHREHVGRGLPQAAKGARRPAAGKRLSASKSEPIGDSRKARGGRGLWGAIGRKDLRGISDSAAWTGIDLPRSCEVKSGSDGASIGGGDYEIMAITSRSRSGGGFSTDHGNVPRDGRAGDGSGRECRERRHRSGLGRGVGDSGIPLPSSVSTPNNTNGDFLVISGARGAGDDDGVGAETGEDWASNRREDIGEKYNETRDSDELAALSGKSRRGSGEPNPHVKGKLSEMLLFYDVPDWLRPVCYLLFFSWVGWFAVIVFGSDWVGVDVFGGDPSSPDDDLRHQAYEDGVAWASMGLAAQAAVISCMGCGPVTWLVRMAGLRGSFLTAVLSQSALMLFAVFVREGPWGKALSLVVLAALGVPLALIESLPYMMVGMFSPRETHGQLLGKLNVWIVLAQLVLTLCINFIVEHVDDGDASVLAAGVIASAVALLFVPSIDRPGKEASASTSGASSAAEDVGTCIGVCESKTTEGPSGSPNRALLR